MGLKLMSDPKIFPVPSDWVEANKSISYIQRFQNLDGTILPSAMEIEEKNVGMKPQEPQKNFRRATSKYEPHRWFFLELLRQMENKVNGRTLKNIHLSWLKERLDPVDYDGLGLNSFSYEHWTNVQAPNLRFGSPTTNIRIRNDNCLVCLPVLHYPAHCELHFHIRKFMPSDAQFCRQCNGFMQALWRYEGDSLEDPVCIVCKEEFGTLRRRRRRRISAEMTLEDGTRIPRSFNGANFTVEDGNDKQERIQEEIQEEPKEETGRISPGNRIFGL